MDDLKKYGELQNVNCIVYVDASYKSKRFDTDEAFIKMNEGKVVPVAEIPLPAGRTKKPEETGHYFYLYFGTSTKDSEEIRKESEMLKKAIKTYFLNQLQNTLE